MTPIAIMDLTPYKHFINNVYMSGCLRMLSPLHDFTALCVNVFVAETMEPQSSDVILDHHLSRAPITDDQYQEARASVIRVVNLMDALLFVLLASVDTRLYSIKYDYNATTMILTLYVDNK